MTTDRTRSDYRRDYRNFPASYGELLHAFAASPIGSASLGPMTEADARAAMRDLYRFKMFLIAGVEANPSDAFARELLDIARIVMLRVSPCAVDDPRGAHMVELSMNPIERAMRDRAPVQREAL